MTIRKGEAWGVEVPWPDAVTVAGSDAELAGLVAADRAGAYAVSGSDLHRTLGAPPVGGPAPAVAHRLPVDLLVVTVDDGRHRDEHLAVAHVVAHRGRRPATWLGWWRGPILAVLNTDHVGTWNVAPGAHPNDGRFDVVEVEPSMSIRNRWQARRRLVAGTHVPHPAIRTTRATSRAWEFTRPLTVWIDGRRVGAARALSVEIVPDGFAVHV